MTTVEIGRGKSGRRAYPLDEIGIVPSRRTRDPEEVSIAWQIDAYRFELPLVAVADGQRGVAGDRGRRSAGSAGSPCSTSKGCGPGYDDPEPLLAEIAELDEDGGHQAAAGDLRRADQGRADRPADRGDPRRPG